MGVHRLKMLSSEVHDLYHGVQVMQILPAHLKSRAAHQPPLSSQAQLSPGFFDAPGAAQALLPRPPGRARTFQPVSLVFIQPYGLLAVAHANQAVADASEAVFCATVRSVLAALGGYECQEYEGTFMVACAGPRMAAEVCLALQEWLLAADWPADLLEIEEGKLVLTGEGMVLRRGLACRAGIYTGAPLSVVPHTTSGRADYFGAIVNRAARLMAGAKAGEVLLDKMAALGLLAEWQSAAAEAAVAVQQQHLATHVRLPRSGSHMMDTASNHHLLASLLTSLASQPQYNGHGHGSMAGRSSTQASLMTGGGSVVARSHAAASGDNASAPPSGQLPPPLPPHLELQGQDAHVPPANLAAAARLSGHVQQQQQQRREVFVRLGSSASRPAAGLSGAQVSRSDTNATATAGPSASEARQRPPYGLPMLQAMAAGGAGATLDSSQSGATALAPSLDTTVLPASSGATGASQAGAFHELTSATGSRASGASAPAPVAYPAPHHYQQQQQSAATGVPPRPPQGLASPPPPPHGGPAHGGAAPAPAVPQQHPLLPAASVAAGVVQVQFVDLGEFQLKGLVVAQSVVALRLRSRWASGQEQQASAGGGMGKAVLVKPGRGLINEVPVRLPLSPACAATLVSGLMSQTRALQ